jgi:hypothetical protein
MRKRLLILSVGIVVVLCCWLLVRPASRAKSIVQPVARDRFSQIRAGKHKSEVVEILGCPPGDYRTRPAHGQLLYDFEKHPPIFKTMTVDYWFFDDTFLWVAFNSADYVTVVDCKRLSYPVQKPPDDVFARTRKWFWQLIGF